MGADVVVSCDELAGRLGRALVDPLRLRIARSFEDCNGDLEEVGERLRALYREWKGQHIGTAVRHYTAAAYAWGAYEGAPDGAKLRWLVDRTVSPAPTPTTTPWPARWPRAHRSRRATAARRRTPAAGAWPCRPTWWTSLSRAPRLQQSGG